MKEVFLKPRRSGGSLAYLQRTQAAMKSTRSRKLYAAKLGAHLRHLAEIEPRLWRARSLRNRAEIALAFAADLSDSCTWYANKGLVVGPIGSDLELFGSVPLHGQG